MRKTTASAAAIASCRTPVLSWPRLRAISWRPRWTSSLARATPPDTRRLTRVKAFSRRRGASPVVMAPPLGTGTKTHAGDRRAVNDSTPEQIGCQRG